MVWDEKRTARDRARSCSLMPAVGLPPRAPPPPKPPAKGRLMAEGEEGESSLGLKAAFEWLEKGIRRRREQEEP